MTSLLSARELEEEQQVERAAASKKLDQGAIDAKIMADLDVVKDKMDLCNAMLHPGAGDPVPSLKSHEAMLGVIGFLEACAPRMVELVEAAAQGALSEDVFAVCLDINDRLQKQLADIDTAALTETAASTTAAAAAAPSPLDGFDEDLFFADDGDGESSKPPAVGGKSTGVDDDDDDDGKKPSSSSSSNNKGEVDMFLGQDMNKLSVQDSFDEFLAERTSK